jgi:hypothetical protein
VVVDRRLDALPNRAPTLGATSVMYLPHLYIHKATQFKIQMKAILSALLYRLVVGSGTVVCSLERSTTANPLLVPANALTRCGGTVSQTSIY